jgi:hypothetical protein
MFFGARESGIPFRSRNPLFVGLNSFLRRHVSSRGIEAVRLNGEYNGLDASATERRQGGAGGPADFLKL